MAAKTHIVIDKFSMDLVCLLHRVCVFQYIPCSHHRPIPAVLMLPVVLVPVTSTSDCISQPSLPSSESTTKIEHVYD